jgi:hypothetical protein
MALKSLEERQAEMRARLAGDKNKAASRHTPAIISNDTHEEVVEPSESDKPIAFVQTRTGITISRKELFRFVWSKHLCTSHQNLRFLTLQLPYALLPHSSGSTTVETIAIDAPGNRLRTSINIVVKQ